MKKGVVLVAGAGPGIGMSICKRFAREGYKVCAVRRNKDAALLDGYV